MDQLISQITQWLANHTGFAIFVSTEEIVKFIKQILGQIIK
jgi:hypothetical protein